ADVNGLRLVAGEERRVVTVKAVADRLHVALVALRRVLVAAMVLRSYDRMIAVHLRIAIELVRDRQPGVGCLPVAADEMPALAGGAEHRPVGLLHGAERTREGGERLLHATLDAVHDASGYGVVAARGIREDPRVVGDGGQACVRLRGIAPLHALRLLP